MALTLSEAFWPVNPSSEMITDGKKLIIDLSEAGQKPSEMLATFYIIQYTYYLICSSVML